MLITLIWSFICFVLICCSGLVLEQLLDRISHSESRAWNIEKCFFFGLAFSSLIAAHLSLFIPLNSYALIAYSITILFLVFFLNPNWNFSGRFDLQGKLSWGLLGICLFFLMVVTASEIGISDSRLYHSQNIQWIRNYGLVPGLGNFVGQFGFNTMFFPVSALFTLDVGFSGQNILIYPLNILALSMLLLQLVRGISNKKDDSNTFRFLFYCLCLAFSILLLFKYANSPSPDAPVAIVMIFSFLFLERCELKLNSKNLFALSLLLFITMTFKLSVVFLGLFIIAVLWHSFSLKKLSGVFALGTLVLIPFLIRNYYLSGYLIFPFPAIDLFDVDWKIPYETAAAYKSVVESWAKIPQLHYSKVEALSFLEWFRIWFSNADLLNKLILIFAASSIMLFIPWRKKDSRSYLILHLIIWANLSFWFLTAPDPRFAMGSLILAVSLFGAFLMSKLFSILKLSQIIKPLLLSGLLCMNLFYYRTYVSKLFIHPSSFLISESFPKVDLKTSEKTPNFVYKIANGKQKCGNAPLPCAPFEREGITLRTGEFKDGFKIKKIQ